MRCDEPPPDGPRPDNNSIAIAGVPSGTFGDVNGGVGPPPGLGLGPGPSGLCAYCFKDWANTSPR